MPLETATFPSDLVTSNPAASDGMNNADDHMRLTKAVLKTTLAGVNAALTRIIGSSYGLLSGDGAAATPAYSFASETTLGIWRSSAGVMTATGILRPLSDVGQIADFGMAAAPAGWLVCDGQAISRTTYADLFAAIGTTWGTGDGSTTFNVPNLLSRFRRHRDNGTLAGVVGTLKAPANLAHTHVVSGTTATENATHAHTYSGTTGSMSANASHSHSYNNSNATSAGVTGGGSFSLPISDSAGTTGATNTDHQHTYSGTTAAENANHAHTFNVTSAGGSADDANEARPYSAAVLACIRY